MTRARPVLIVLLSLLLLAMPLGPGLAAQPPAWPASFWGQPTIPGYAPTASTALVVYCDENGNHTVDTGEPPAAATTLRDAGSDGWVYTVHVPAGVCAVGGALVFELSQPPTASNDPLTVAEDAGPTAAAVTVVEGLGAVEFADGQDPVWQGGTNTRRDLALLTPYGVTLVITTGPSHGEASVAAATITYTPTADYCGSDTLSYTVTDADGQSATGELDITVTCVNDPPSALTLSNNAVDEEQPVGTVVGALSVTDPDIGDTHAYTLVPIDGSSDHTAFQIVGAELRTAAVLHYATQSSYTLKVRASDDAASTESVFTIAVRDVNHAPTDLTLTGATVAENAVAGTAVGTLSTTDPDAGDAHEYTLVAGVGDDDNASFTIVGSTLQVTGALDHESRSTASVRIQTSDGRPGGTLQKAFPITITDVNEAPVVMAPAGQTITQDGAFTTVDLSGLVQDQDASDAHTWSASGATNLEVQINGSQATITIKTAGWDGVETITFTAEDTGGLTAGAAAEFRVLARQTIPLAEGWNMIGLGLATAASDPDTVLAGIDARYTLVYAWDTAANDWRLFDNSDPDYPMDDGTLNALSRGQGLWVYVTEGGDPLHIDGQAEETTAVTVEENSWHLVSLASAVAEDLPGALDDHGLAGKYALVYGYDAADATDPWRVFDPDAADWANDLRKMEPGRGYWLRTGAGQSGTWTVTYERSTTP